MEGERDTEKGGKREEERRRRDTSRRRQVGLDVMEIPTRPPPGGRNTIFRMLRSNTSPGKIFPISHWRETEPAGQEGESSYDGVCVRSINVCAGTLTHSLPGWEMLPLSQP